MENNSGVPTPAPVQTLFLSPVATQKTDKEIATDLVLAILANTIPTVVEILGKYNNFRYINTESKTGITALEAAIFVQSVEIVTYLLNLPGIDANKQNSRLPNNTPLTLAVSFSGENVQLTQKNAEIVRLLCYHEDIDVNKRKHGGYTPLMVAVENANLLLVNVLLECSRKTRSQIATALFNNVGLRSPFALKNIIKNKIFSFLVTRNRKILDINATVDDTSIAKDMTALSFAIRMGNLKIVERLLMEDNIKIPLIIKPFQTLEQFRAKVDPEKYDMDIFVLLDKHVEQVAALQAAAAPD